jgi:antitoxin VapB
MGYRTKAFKSGNSVAVRLPKEFGVQAGAQLTLEQRRGEIAVRPSIDVDDEKRRTRAMLDEIARIWEEAGGPPAEPWERDPDIFPDRPGLY